MLNVQGIEELQKLRLSILWMSMFFIMINGYWNKSRVKY